MGKNNTSMTSESRKKMPGRGPSKRTLILDAIKKQSIEGLPDNATRAQVESAWFEHLLSVALDNKNKDSGLCMRLITERGWSAVKPSAECIEFEFDPSLPPTEQASQVMAAVAGGHVPPDLGITFISGIRSMIDIEANTELKERIDRLEAMLNGQSG
jgi:hypothetical protein